MEIINVSSRKWNIANKHLRGKRTRGMKATPAMALRSIYSMASLPLKKSSAPLSYAQLNSAQLSQLPSACL